MLVVGWCFNVAILVIGSDGNSCLRPHISSKLQIEKGHLLWITPRHESPSRLDINKSCLQVCLLEKPPSFKSYHAILVWQKI
ncbi:hypothetical protein CEXT_662661 [Caerostris extrusa]|uniref:Uncharacterized protein n=1 Tax=Caerostris extrusa TaxID=172846 RepID=A0AAV4UKV9_CAEEX|nr:hypothetical protein CEXT_662661 [Caerostris extrusa]